MTNDKPMFLVARDLFLGRGDHPTQVVLTLNDPENPALNIALSRKRGAIHSGGIMIDDGGDHPIVLWEHYPDRITLTPEEGTQLSREEEALCTAALYNFFAGLDGVAPDLARMGRQVISDAMDWATKGDAGTPTKH